MRQLRLIKPWRLQTRHQNTGYDCQEAKVYNAYTISCSGPQRAGFEAEAMCNPRTVKKGSASEAYTIAAPADFFINRQAPRN